jgi:hypothetical protein
MSKVSYHIKKLIFILWTWHLHVWSSIKTSSSDTFIRWHQFSLFVVFTKCLDPRVLEFVVSNITSNKQWENCISLDFYYRSLSAPAKSVKIRTPRLIIISQYIICKLVKNTIFTIDQI